MRLARAPSSAVDRQYELLRIELEFEGANRLTSLHSTSEWFSSQANVAVTRGLPDDEAGAAALMQVRLEELVEELMPALNSCAPELEDLTLYLRPLRSGLSTAFSVPTSDGQLIVVDDAINDLTLNLIQLMLVAWGPPRTSGEEPEARPVASLPDVVRVARAALGSVRWNGSLWLPVRIDLDEATWSFGHEINRLAQMFVLAHEMGHAAAHPVPRQAVLEHADWERELSADTFAVRVLLHMFEDDGEVEPQAVAFIRLATRVALEVMAFADDAFTLNQDSHPPAGDRLRIAFERAGHGSEPDPIELVADHFFGALASMTTLNRVPLSEAVEISPTFRLDPVALPNRRDLDQLDQIEAVMALPLPHVLSQLGAAAESDLGRAPQPVVELVRRANARLGTAEGLEPVSVRGWTRVLAGSIWLKDLVSAQGLDQAEATLEPPPGTRFCDWAGWVEHSVADENTAPVLAALRVLVKEGEGALGDPDVIDPLETAVRRWIADATPSS